MHIDDPLETYPAPRVRYNGEKVTYIGPSSSGGAVIETEQHEIKEVSPQDIQPLN